MTEIDPRYEAYSKHLAAVGQSHLLGFWDSLDAEQRRALLDDLDQIDFDRILPVIDSLVRSRPALAAPARLEPAEAYPSEPRAGQQPLYARAREAGEAAIRSGRVAAFTVAGGQGTRLGYDGPKGGFPISPIRHACLFQLFGESLLGVERRYGRRPRWYIMTSPQNHAATIEIFRAGAWFGLRPDDVTFFPQGQVPAFLPDGRIAMESKHRVALSPDGHGGSLAALRASGALEDMRRRGIEHISYFQVDNPLVKPIDPLFLGLHIATGSEMSSKAVSKAHDLERVGNLCRADGQLTVIEYSDMPETLATAKNPDGTRRFDAGNVAIHVIDRGLVERLTDPRAAVQLPWHRAEKKVDVIDDAGRPVRPTAPNVVKIEMFVFDAIQLARNPLVFMTPREEEFSPVKNAEGADSPATTRRDLVRRAARWLEACGCAVARRDDGEPAALIEISPAYALDTDDLRSRPNLPRALRPGESLLLA